MTQTDPFATPAADKGPAPQEFGQPVGGGNYPKPVDLLGCLLALECGGDVTLQPSLYNKDPLTGLPVMVKRAEATTHVIDGPEAAKEYIGQCFDDMYWSQGPMVKGMEKAHGKGQKMILGTLRRFPTSDEKKRPKGCQTWEEVEQAFEDYRDRKRKEEPKFAWALDQYTEADALKARAYLAGK